MAKIKCKTSQQSATASSSAFDLFRLSKSKEVVDISPNTLRGYFREGLSFYRRGKSVFVSKSELASFLMTPASAN